jgi:hypothetical protein
MSKFLITKDQKVTTWERTNYLVEADNLSEAIDKMVVFAEKDTVEDDPENGIFEAMGGSIEYIIEASVPIPLEKNEGMPTLEFINREGETIYDNVNGKFTERMNSVKPIQPIPIENINL